MTNPSRQDCQDANRMAVLANQALYDKQGMPDDAEVFPHLRHPQLLELYAGLVPRVFRAALQNSKPPRVLDLGAGEGSATLPFLELGAYVTAVDISESQLAALVRRCGRFADRLDVWHENISDALKGQENCYDVVAMNSCLHHIPDYLKVIEDVIPVLRPHGLFFSFQDPLRYDSLSPGALLFSKLAYFCWRMFQGNYLEGLKTRIRRMRGVYIPGSNADDAEYHATRNGVDQDAIAVLFQSQGFSCEVIRYFSTQGGILQVVGCYLGIENTFAIIAQKVA